MQIKLYDKLKVKRFESRDELGKAAGKDIIKCIEEVLRQKEYCNIIFASAPSQNETLNALKEHKDLQWERINVFHMDEYIGLESNAPQGFSNFLQKTLFEFVTPKSLNYIDMTAKDAEAECVRYGGLLKKNLADICCMGIGENGHLAFNDPPVADFYDKKTVKVVELDEICRMQQVNDGCFEKIDFVPKTAITLTIPTLIKSKYIFCMVPALTKANAVKNTLHAAISTDCPSTILREHENAILYLDEQSASLID